MWRHVCRFRKVQLLEFMWLGSLVYSLASCGQNFRHGIGETRRWQGTPGSRLRQGWKLCYGIVRDRVTKPGFLCWRGEGTGSWWARLLGLLRVGCLQPKRFLSFRMPQAPSTAYNTKKKLVSTCINPPKSAVNVRSEWQEINDKFFWSGMMTSDGFAKIDR